MSREFSNHDSNDSPPTEDKAPWRGDFLEMHNVIRDTLADPKLNLESKESAAQKITMAISESVGGRIIYVPLGYKMVRSQRNLEIYRALRDGTATARSLAISHDLSVATIYQVAANMQMKLGESVSSDCTSPYFQRAANRRRNKEIRDAIRLNIATPRELAKKYGLTLTHIRWIAGKPETQSTTDTSPQEQNQ